MTSSAKRYTEEEVLEGARRQYTEGRAVWEIDPARMALIIIDMEDEFVKPEYSVHWIPDAYRQVPKIKLLIETCRDQGIPIIYTCCIYHPKGYDAGLIPEVPMGMARAGMTELFREVKKDNEIGFSEALRRSMKTLANDDDLRFAHPAHWAPFVVVGEGQRVAQSEF